jgi:recombination protein RecA
VDIRKITSIKQGEETIGNRVRAKVVKNKLAPPFRNAEFDVLFDRGISWTGDVLDLAAENGIIQKSGAWFSFGDQRLGQGRENTVQYLQDTPAVLAEIENELLAKLFPAEAAGGAPGGAEKEKAGAAAETPPAPPKREKKS